MSAELNVVLNLVSQVGKDLPNVTADVKKIKKIVEEVLKVPEQQKGGAFLKFFDVKDADDLSKAFDKIRGGYDRLKQELQGPVGKSVIDQIGGTSVDKAIKKLDDLAKGAVLAFSQQKQAEFADRAKKFFDLTPAANEIEKDAAVLRKIAYDLGSLNLLEKGGKRVSADTWIKAINQRTEALKKSLGIVEETEAKETAAVEKGSKKRTKIVEDEAKTKVEKTRKATKQVVDAVEDGQKAEEEAVKRGRKRKGEDLTDISPKAREAGRRRLAEIAAQNKAIVQMEQETVDTVLKIRKPLTDMTAEKASTDARIALATQTSAKLIAIERKLVADVTKEWEKLAKNLEKAVPKRSTKEVVIHFKGKASPEDELMNTFAKIKQKFLALKADAGNLQARIEFDGMGSVAAATEAVKKLDRAIEETTKDAIDLSNKMSIASVQPDLKYKRDKDSVTGQPVLKFTNEKRELEELEKATKQSFGEVVKAKEASVAKLIEADRKLTVAVKQGVEERKRIINPALSAEEAARLQSLERQVKAQIEKDAQLLKSREKTIADMQRMIARPSGVTAEIWRAAPNLKEEYKKDLQQLEAKTKVVADRIEKNLQVEAKIVAKLYLEASPQVPFSEGIERVRAKLVGLPKETQFTIKLAGVEKLQQMADDAAVKMAQAQTRVTDAKTAAASSQTAEAKKMFETEQKLAQQELDLWTRVYDGRQKEATEMFNVLEKEAIEYAKVARASEERSAMSGMTGGEQKRVQEAIAAGNQILAAAKKTADERIKIEDRAYQEMGEAAARFGELIADGGSAEEIAAAKRVLEVKKQSYRDAMTERQKATAQFKTLAEQELGIVADVSSKEVALERQKQKEIEASYKDRSGDINAAAQREFEINAAWDAREVAAERQKQKDLSTATGSRVAEIEEEARKESQIREMWRKQELAGEKQKQAEIKAISKGRTAEVEAEARREAEINAAWNAKEVADEKERAANIAAIDKALAEKRLSEEKQVAAQKTALWKKYDADRVKDSKETAKALKANLQQQKQDIVDGLREAKEAALTARAAIDESLAKGLRPGGKAETEQLTAAYNRIKEQVALIAQANRDAATAVRKGSVEQAQLATEAARKARQEIEKELAGIGKKWDDVKGAGLNASKAWEDRMTTMSYRFSHVGFQLGMIGTAAMGAFLGPLAAVKEFAKTIEYTNSILGGNQQQLEALKKTALDLGSSTIYSSQQIAEGMRTLAQAGLTAEQAMKGVVPILNFAGAGMLNMNDAARIAISTMNQFGKGLSDLPEITQNIAAAANTTNAEVKDFGEALKNVGPTAAAVGATLEETTRALGVLSQAGIQASTAGTQLRGVYRRLLEGSNEASKAGKIFKQLGIDVTDSGNDFQNLENILGQLKEKTKDMSSVERAAKVYEIFGQRAGGPAVIAMLNAGQQAFDNVKKSVEGAAQAAQIAKDRGEGLWGTLERLKNAVTVLTQEIGYSSGSAFKPFINGLIALVGAVRTALQTVPGLKTIVTIFLSLSAAAGVIFLVTSALSLMFSTLLSVLGLSGAVKTFMLMMEVSLMSVGTQATFAAKAMAVWTAVTTQAAISAKALWLAIMGPLGLVAAFAALVAAVAIFKVRRDALKEWDEQIGVLTARMEKFRSALDKPIASKKEFSLFSLDQQKNEIKHLKELEQYWVAAVNELQAKIEKKKGAFGLGNTDELEKELKAAQEKLTAAQANWKHIRIPVAVTTDTAKTELLQFVDEMDIFFGNKKIGLKGFNLKNVVEGIEKAKQNLNELELQAKTTDLSPDAAGFKAALAELDIAVADSAAGRLQQERNFNEQRISATTEYFDMAMQLTAQWSQTEGEEGQNMLKQREEAYAATIESLEGMYNDARAKMDQYSKDIVKAEQELAKARVESYNNYLEATSVSEKLKSQERIQREARERIERLKAFRDEQAALGTKESIEAAKRAQDEIDRLIIDAAKKADDRIAEIILKGIEAQKKIEENNAKAAKAREDRNARADQSDMRSGEAAIRRSEALAAAKRDLATLEAKTDKSESARESRLARIVALKERIVNLERRDAAASDIAGSAAAIRNDTSATEDSLERSNEALQAQVDLYNQLKQLEDPRVKAALAAYEAKVKEGTAAEGLAGLLNELRDLGVLIAENDGDRVGLATDNLNLARAHFKVEEERAAQAKLALGVIKAVHEGLANIKVGENVDEQLKTLMAKWKTEGADLVVSLKMQDKDKRVFELIDQSTGAKQEIEIDLKTGKANLNAEQLYEKLKKTVKIETSLGGTAQKQADDLKQNLTAPVKKDVEVNIKTEDAKKKSEELGKIVAKGTFVEVERDGQKFWTNYLATGEKVIQTMDLWSGQTKKAEEAGKEMGKAIDSGINPEGVMGKFNASIEALPGSLTAMFGEVATSIGTSFGNIATTLQQQLTDAKEATVTSVKQTTSELAADVTIQLAKGHGEAAEKAGETWREFYVATGLKSEKAARDIANDMVSSHEQAAKDSAAAWDDGFFDKMIDGFKDMWDWLKKLVSKSKDVEGGGGEFGGAGDSSDDNDNGGARFGGLVQFAKGMAAGGHIPGYGGGDRHPVLLESGEYVLPKEMVRGLGVHTLNAMRSMFLRGLGLPSFSVGVPRMATGGPVGPTNSDRGSNGLYTLNLTLGGNQFPMLGRKDIIEAFMETMKREGMTRR